MNKAGLVGAIAKDCGLTKADVNRVLDALIQHITKALKKNERVALVGFGTFVVSRRRASMRRNPHNGLPIKIPSRRVPRFAPGKNLKEAIE